MDFGIFGFSPEQAQEFRNFMANQHLHQNHGGGAFGGVRADASASATTGGAGANATDGQQSGQNSQPTSGDFGGAQGGGDQQEPVLMHNASHNGVVCDVCNTEIRGFRYKCMQCPDYDLCAKCEHKGNHAGHIMMRIAFPEQSRSAIRRFMQNPSPPETPPHLGHHGHGHGHHGHGHGHHGHHRGPHGPHAFGEHPFFAFGGPFGGRRGGCHRRGRGGERGDTSNDEEGGNATAGERPATAPGCPYNMGKKELKRWSKWMKRAASHQHRSAEAYARAAAASGTNATPGAPGAEAEAPGPLPMDFAAVASQIQEFLNYWGVPVDVVELYDQFGNRGQPAASGAEGSAQANQGQATGQQQQNAATGTTNNAAAGTTTEATANAETSQQNLDQQPASPASNLSENMEQMRLGGNAGEQQQQQRQQESLLMDLDENSGWTIVGNQSREQSPTTNAAPVTTTQQQPSAPQGSMDSQNGNQPQVTSPTSTPNSGSSMPFASAGSNNSMNGNGIPVAATTAAPATTPTAPPAFPAGLPNVPLYPVLNQPQIQQILQGVSTAVGNVVRNIPIVTDPRGPMGATTTTPANPQAPRPATGQPETGSMELDARSMKTLNQLLAMGFSNEGGYLTRLVVAKKGDLEAVLSSLFPN